MLFFCADNVVELFDLPDELILMILNKVKPKVLLLSSIVNIGNDRLEKLALEKSHSIDLTLAYCLLPYQYLLRRFASHVTPYTLGKLLLNMIFLNYD